MEKNKKKIIKITLILFALVVGMDIFMRGNLLKFIASVNPMNLKASDVPYTSNSQLTVQGAIDDLYTKSNTLNTQLTTCQTQLNNSVPIDSATFDTNTAKTVYASSKGVCIKRNGILNCFKINNLAEEQNHIQQVFSDISCNVYSNGVSCLASDFSCNVYSTGNVDCLDRSDDSFCSVFPDGYLECD